MTDRAQFEAMLEALINEDQETAQEIFHNIVVGKSREIYEELLENDFGKDSGNPYGKGEEDEGTDEEEPEMDSEEEPEMDGEEEPEMDGEEGDEEEPEMDGEEEPEMDGEEGEGDIEDRVMDLEDALEDLKAEFEQLLAGEEGEEHMGGDDMGGMGGMDDMGDEMGAHDELDELMEYVNKVSPPQHGDNGVNTRTPIASANKMGGTASNIAQGHREVTADVGAKSTVNGNALNGPGVKPNPNASGNINVPGGKAGKTAFTHREPGHGAEKKGAKPGQMVGAGSGEMGGMRGEQNKQAILRPVKK